MCNTSPPDIPQVQHSSSNINMIHTYLCILSHDAHSFIIFRLGRYAMNTVLWCSALWNSSTDVVFLVEYRIWDTNVIFHKEGWGAITSVIQKWEAMSIKDINYIPLGVIWIGISWGNPYPNHTKWDISWVFHRQGFLLLLLFIQIIETLSYKSIMLYGSSPTTIYSRPIKNVHMYMYLEQVTYQPSLYHDHKTDLQRDTK